MHTFELVQSQSGGFFAYINMTEVCTPFPTFWPLPMLFQKLGQLVNPFLLGFCSGIPPRGTPSIHSHPISC